MTHDDVVGPQLERLELQAFTTGPLAVDKRTIRTFDVFDVNLSGEVTLVHLSGETEIYW